ncbi:MAG: hypothetical protein ABEJ98_02220 [Candidatus Nanohaloarchaea archaeon]
MRKELLTAFLVAVALGMVASGSAATESSDVNATVTSTVAIDVKPTNFTFPSASVGSQVTTSDKGYTAIDIENTGSEYIAQLYANSTIHTSDPFGTGQESNYNAGNFFQIRPTNQSGILNGDTDDFHYVNRVEFLESTNNGDVPSYIDVSGQFDGANANNVFVGRFRMGDEERFFAIPTGSGDVCDGTGTFGLMRVANTSKTDTQRGTIDFTDSGTDWTQYNITTTSNGPYGVTEAGPTTPNGVNLYKNRGTASEVNRTYDVLTHCSGSNPRVIRTRYNTQAGGNPNLVSDGTAVERLIYANGNSDLALAPGSSVTVQTAIEVPQGVAQGQVGDGKVRFIATADTSLT